MSAPNDRDDASALLQRIKQDISVIVDTLEARFLHLIKERGRGNISPDDLAAELSPLMRDLNRCFGRLVEVEEREDLNFKTTKDLQEIDEHCLWLFRKIRVEQTFSKKLSQEAKLRSLISHAAFGVYQTVLDLDGEQREFTACDDAAIRTLMLEETN